MTCPFCARPLEQTKSQDLGEGETGGYFSANAYRCEGCRAELEHELLFKALHNREEWSLTVPPEVVSAQAPHPLLGPFACPTCGTRLIGAMPREAEFAPSVPKGMDPALDDSVRRVDHVCPGCRARSVLTVRAGQEPELAPGA